MQSLTNEPSMPTLTRHKPQLESQRTQLDDLSRALIQAELVRLHNSGTSTYEMAVKANLSQSTMYIAMRRGQMGTITAEAILRVAGVTIDELARKFPEIVAKYTKVSNVHQSGLTKSVNPLIRELADSQGYNETVVAQLQLLVDEFGKLPEHVLKIAGDSFKKTWTVVSQLVDLEKQ